jgi:hypothetical protein
MARWNSWNRWDGDQRGSDSDTNGRALPMIS